MSSSPASAPEPQVAEAIARVEQRRGMMERLSRMGMALCDEICQRAAEAPAPPEPRHDPGRAFAAASRSVRMTLTLEVKFDELILALRKGVDPAWKSAAHEAVGEPASPLAPKPRTPRVEVTDELRDEAYEAVLEAVEREFESYSEVDRLMGRVHRNLMGRGSYDDLLGRDFRACIETICSDMGVDPRSVWLDRTGESRGKTSIPDLSANLHSTPDQVRRQLFQQGEKAEASPHRRE